MWAAFNSKEVKRTSAAEGFSAVELLIALVVASIFLFAGISFYNSVVRYGAEARNRASADHIAYDTLRRYEAKAPSTCTPSNPATNAPVTADDNAGRLNTPLYSVTITCPTSAIPALSKIYVKVTYNEKGVTKSVEQGSYATAF